MLDRAWAEWEAQDRAAFRLFPDVLSVLDGFERSGTRIGMVTNGAGTVQREKLEALGLAGRFDPLVISSEVGAKKPDPAIFEVALHAAGVAATDAWFIGDSLWHDVPGALATGIRTFWLDRDGTGPQPDAPQPDAVIASLADLRGSAEIG